MSHPVNWFQIGGPNGHELQHFYEKVFGWKMQPMPGSTDAMVPAEKGGVPGSITTTHNHLASVAVYVAVGDIDAQFGKIQRAGGRMAMPKMELPNDMGSIAGFTDPAGNWIGLWMAGKAPPKAPSAKKKSAKKTTKKAAKSAPVKKAAAPKKKKAAKKTKK